MGKNRHSKDKLYISFDEHSKDWGGYKKKVSKNTEEPLPFNHCSLTLLPFKNPVCTKEGNVFELTSIYSYINKFHKNPITGKPLQKQDLIKLNFSKNEKGKYHCPILYKEFNENSHIIAIAETGNVFSYEAFKDFNQTINNFKDLLKDQIFDPSKIIVVQDPKKMNSKIMKNFYYFKKSENISFIKEETKDNETINHDAAQKRILAQLKREKPEEDSDDIKEKQIESKKKKKI